MDHDEAVPYFVLHLEHGHAKAVFTVPTDLVKPLISYPILCRGSYFELRLDTVIRKAALRASPPATASRQRVESSQQHQFDNDNNSNDDPRSYYPTSFLSTEFESLEPEETASEIAQRLSIRIDNVDAVQISGILGI